MPQTPTLSHDMQILTLACKYDLPFLQNMTNQSEILLKGPCSNITLAYIFTEPVPRGIVQMTRGLHWC